MDAQNESADQVQNPKKRILIVDDHPIFRLGLAGLISEQPHLEVCGDAESAPLALEAMKKFKPDSDRELEVLQLLGKGHSTRSIADTLHLSVKTIETHRA